MKIRITPENEMVKHLKKPFLLALILLLHSHTAVQGEIIIVENKIQERGASPGETYEGVFFVRNPSARPAQVKIYQTPYQAFSELGGSEPGEPAKMQGSNAKWITFKPRGVVIRPRATIGINYTVIVPSQEALAGVFASVIVVEEMNQRNDESGGDHRLGIKILTNVGAAQDVSSSNSIVPGGRVKGRVVDVETKQGVSDIILKINDVLAVTDKRGNFIFDLIKPGRYNFRVQKSSIATSMVTVGKNPRKLNILEGQVTWVQVGLTQATTVIGQVMVYPFLNEASGLVYASADPQTVLEEAELAKGFALGRALVEISNGTETRRRLSDAQGGFVFKDLPGGKWAFSIKDRYLPAAHHLDDDDLEINVAAGQENRVFIRVLPGRREGVQPKVLLASADHPETRRQQIQKALPEAKPTRRLVKHAVKSGDKAEKRFYIVRSGDWLSRIAEKFYGDPMRYPELFAANRNVIEDADRISPGQKLVIPSAGEKYYTVRSGDWLSRIAEKFYGDPMRYPELFAANRNVIKNPDRIFPGQRIKLVVPTENYVVRKNDWLSKIAERVYNDAHQYRQIVKANEASIEDPDLIYPGQKLQLPKVREVEPLQ